MPSVVRLLSSDFPAFPVFAPVRRRSGGVGAVSATPLPPSARLSAIPAHELLDGSAVPRGNETPQLALPRYPLSEKDPRYFPVTLTVTRCRATAGQGASSGGLAQKSLELGEELRVRTAGGESRVRGL